jgi:hypothetical protein
LTYQLNAFFLSKILRLPCPPWQRLQPPGQRLPLQRHLLPHQLRQGRSRSKILRFTPSACSPRPVRDRTRGGSGLAAVDEEEDGPAQAASYAKLSNLALDLSTQLDVCEKALSPAVRGVVSGCGVARRGHHRLALRYSPASSRVNMPEYLKSI